MNRRLSKSGIEYLDYGWNFYSGCRNKKLGICPVQNCWAEAITKRMVHNYPVGFEPTFCPEAFLSPLSLKKPSIIGCAFMGDLFGGWIDPGMMINVPMVPGLSHAEPLREQVFRTINQCPQHTFLFLTKCPWNLIRWSPFPDNCWVGATATDWASTDVAMRKLANIEASVKFISFEPLLSEVKTIYKARPRAVTVIPYKWWAGIDWVIIGAQTKPYKPPEMEWVTEIVWACTKAGIPVFLKNNLIPCLRAEKPFLEITKTHRIYPRQEMPKCSLC